MKKWNQDLCIGLLCFVAIIVVQGCCEPEVTGSVPNTLYPQQTNNWCWAATTQMLAKHFSITVNQCDLANARFSKTNCCDDEPTSETCRKTNDCNTPGWPMLDYVGLKFTEVNTALSWTDLRKQIYCSKKPMGYAYGQSGVVGHVLVIKGYLTLSGTNYVVLNDPWEPCDGEERIITYDEYVDPAGAKTHWSTFYNLEKK